MTWISAQQRQAILSVPHFGDSDYAGWDLEKMLESYIVCFVEQVLGFEQDRKIGSVADIGTGYGWLAFAFALRTKAKIIAMDVSEPRLLAAKRIAEILAIPEGRIEWRVGSLGNLPFADREVDAALCIEVIEHTGDDPDLLRDLGRITDDLLVVTTPSKSFPIIRHDTCLPFCHWLSPRLRNPYASAFGRRHLQDGNRFWTASKLLSALDDFERVSSFLQYRTYRHYLDAERRVAAPSRGFRSALSRAKELYYFGASQAGRGSIYLLPNLASTFRRRVVPSPSVSQDRSH
jgi:SAM-dependent methyltransferase